MQEQINFDDLIKFIGRWVIWLMEMMGEYFLRGWKKKYLNAGAFKWKNGKRKVKFESCVC